MLNRVRGLIVGHAIGSSIGSQTKMRLKSDGATVTFPSTVSYRGRPPCSWGSVTDVFLILLKNIEAGGIFGHESELGAAQDLIEWNSGTLDYLFTGPACSSAYEKKIIGATDFSSRPREIAAEMWRDSAGRATFAEPAAYAPADAFVSVASGSTTTGILYASDRCEFVANIVGYICRGVCGGEYNAPEHIDDLFDTIRRFAAGQKIKHPGIFESFGDEVAFWMGLGYAGNIAAIRLDDINTINNPLKTLGCISYVLKCIRYALANNLQPSFRRILIKIADECGYADVHCAVIGAILGGFIGYSELPAGWVEALHDITRLRSIIEEVIPQFLKHVEDGPAQSDESDSPTTTDSSRISSCNELSCLDDLAAIVPGGDTPSKSSTGASVAPDAPVISDEPALPAATASKFSAPKDS